MIREEHKASGVKAASSVAAQVSLASATPQYPLAIKTRWNYQMRMEFGAPLLVIESTLVSEVMGYDTIGGARYARVESSVNGRHWLTERFRVTPEGLFVGKRTEDGEETVLSPPQKILSPTLATGESWIWKASDAPVMTATRVVGKEVTEVPAAGVSGFWNKTVGGWASIRATGPTILVLWRRSGSRPAR